MLVLWLHFVLQGIFGFCVLFEYYSVYVYGIHICVCLHVCVGECHVSM